MASGSIKTLVSEARKTYLLLDEVSANSESTDYFRCVRKASQYATIADSVLIRFTSTSMDEDHEAATEAVLRSLQNQSHPSLARILDIGVVNGPATVSSDPGFYYTIPGFDGLAGTLCHIFNEGFGATSSIPEAFVFHVFSQVADALAYIHRGFRNPDEDADPTQATALSAKDLIDHCHIQLQTSASGSADRNAYGRIMLTDFSRAVNADTFAPRTLVADNGVQWHLDTLRDLQIHDCATLGSLIHTIAHGRPLNHDSLCKCSAGRKERYPYSGQLLHFMRLAASGEVTAEELAQQIRPIADQKKAEHPRLLLEEDVVAEIECEASKFDELLAEATSRHAPKSKTQSETQAQGPPDASPRRPTANAGPGIPMTAAEIAGKDAVWHAEVREAAAALMQLGDGIPSRLQPWNGGDDTKD